MITKKIAAIGLGLSMFVAVATPASAQTVADLQAQIQALMAQLAALQTGSTATVSVAFTQDLTVGSTGPQVVALQQMLVAQGHLTMPAGVAFGYFGSLTQSAVARWQAANGIAPAAGYFGPLSRAKANSMGGVTTGGTTTTGGSTATPGALQGGAGSIDSFSAITSLSGEEVGEGEDDVEIAGVEVEVGEGSDIRLTAVELDFSTQPGNDNLEDFITEVSIMLDGDVVATVDAEDFNDDNDWTRTVSLNSGAIIRAGDTADLTVAVSGVGNLDSDDVGDDWAIDILEVRYVDATGASITDTVAYTAVTWDVVTFATAADLELHVSLSDDDDINDSRAINIDDTDDTDGVELLSFTLEAEGSDITVDDLPVNFDGTGVTNLDDMITRVYLFADGEEVGAETVETDGGTDWTATFDDIDLEISEGDEVTFVVKVDVNDIEAGTFDEGDTLSAQLSSTEVDAIVAEDETGEDVADADLTGTAAGEAHSFYSQGITVEAVSTDSSVNEGETVGTYEIVVDVTAFGDDQYIHELADNASSTDAGFYYTVYKNGAATSTNVTLGDLVSTAADESGEYFIVREGQTERFTITVTVDPDAAGLYTVELGIASTGAVRFDPDNAADASSGDDTWYSIPSSEDVETPAEQLNAS